MYLCILYKNGLIVEDVGSALSDIWISFYRATKTRQILQNSLK